MFLFRRGIAVVFLFLVAGCTATPNLAGWAENSAQLASAIEAENGDILSRIDRNLAELKRGKREGWSLGGFDTPQWQTWRDEYDTQSSEVNAVLEAMVLYSDALASLAAAGETGAEAVDSMVTSLTDAASLVGISFPGASTAIQLARELGTAWNRLQAQNSLAEAMIGTRDTVNQMAAHVQTMVNALANIVQNQARLERELAVQAASPSEMTWYKNNHQNVRTNALAAGTDPVVAQAQLALVHELEMRRAMRDKKRNEAVLWRDSHIKVLKAIEAAAFAWRDSHDAAANILEQCGGLKFVQYECGHFNAANLKKAATRIQAILEADKNNSTAQ